MVEYLTLTQSGMLGSALSGIIVGVMTLAGVYLTHKFDLQKQKRKENSEIEQIRNGLITELRLTDKWLAKVLYVIYDISALENSIYTINRGELENNIQYDLEFTIKVLSSLKTSRAFSKNIYQSNADKIGKLNHESTKFLIRAYSHVEEVKSEMDRLSELLDVDERNQIDQEGWETKEDVPKEVYEVYNSIQSEILLAIIYQKSAVKSLGGSVTQDDRAALALAISQRSPRSQSEEELYEITNKMYEYSDNWEEFKELVDLPQAV